MILIALAEESRKSAASMVVKFLERDASIVSSAGASGSNLFTTAGPLLLIDIACVSDFRCEAKAKTRRAPKRKAAFFKYHLRKTWGVILLHRYTKPMRFRQSLREVSNNQK